VETIVQTGAGNSAPVCYFVFSYRKVSKSSKFLGHNILLHSIIYVQKENGMEKKIIVAKVAMTATELRLQDLGVSPRPMVITSSGTRRTTRRKIVK
jgi:hypothetical protein